MSRRNIIVVGASAGGVEALSAWVAQLPYPLPASVLIVMHIAPAHESLLDRILAARTALKVTAAVDGEKLQPNHIYVAVADRHLMLEDGHVRLTRGPRESRSRPSVDVLFRSAAYTHGPQVIGIILTGALDDGTAGLWAIKDRGGIAIIQDPREALYDSMPQSARRHVKVDYTVSIREMGPLIEQLVNEEVDMTDPPVTPRSTMEIENSIARDGHAFEEGALNLGKPVPLTCPECKGALMRVEDGSSMTRFRCHTGHAYSLRSLLTDLDHSLDRTLWNVVRGIEERILVLRELEQQARNTADVEAALNFERQIDDAQRRHSELRQLLLDQGALWNRGGHKVTKAGQQGR